MKPVGEKHIEKSGFSLSQFLWFTEQISAYYLDEYIIFVTYIWFYSLFGSFFWYIFVVLFCCIAVIKFNSHNWFYVLNDPKVLPLANIYSYRQEPSQPCQLPGTTQVYVENLIWGNNPQSLQLFYVSADMFSFKKRLCKEQSCSCYFTWCWFHGPILFCLCIFARCIHCNLKLYF